MSELHLSAGTVPASGRHDLVTVDGRSFAISGETGDMAGPTHGLVYDDLRHLSRLRMTVTGGRVELLAASTPTPLSAVVVSRVLTTVDDGRRRPATPRPADDVAEVLVIRRRWLAGSLVEELTLRNPHPLPVSVHLELEVAADFAHVFDVKSGTGTRSRPAPEAGSPGTVDAALAPRRAGPHRGRAATGAGRGRPGPRYGGVAPEHRRDGTRSRSPSPCSPSRPASPPSSSVRRELASGVAIRDLPAWRSTVPTVVSLDPRLPTAVDQALADLAALRIVDRAHPDRAVVAAGAPWFMTLFGRDSLLTAWMTLPFDGSLAGGVLASLADLQGREDDPASEEQPGRILHELRRHGGSGAVLLPQPLLRHRRRHPALRRAGRRGVAVAGDRRRTPSAAWRRPSVAPSTGSSDPGDSDGDGFVDYRRRDAARAREPGLEGLLGRHHPRRRHAADGSPGAGRGAGIRVRRAAGRREPWPTVVDIGHHASDLRRRAEALKDRFNEVFWDRRGWFVLGLDADGRPIDSLTTNPGHALWSGIADDDKARRYVERLVDPDLWTGWGLRTLARSMAAYDPLSYHNGSVWPHDTALCIAGAARYGCWDAVDLLVDGALEATRHFDGRPPELFAGVARDDVAMPVAYPSSCSPQAWASASVLLLVRTMLGLEPTADRSGVELVRPDLSGVPDLSLERLEFARHGRCRCECKAAAVG